MGVGYHGVDCISFKIAALGRLWNLWLHPPEYRAYLILWEQQ